MISRPTLEARNPWILAKAQRRAASIHNTGGTAKTSNDSSANVLIDAHPLERKGNLSIWESAGNVRAFILPDRFLDGQATNLKYRRHEFKPKYRSWRRGRIHVCSKISNIKSSFPLVNAVGHRPNADLQIQVRVQKHVPIRFIHLSLTWS